MFIFSANTKGRISDSRPSFIWKITDMWKFGPNSYIDCKIILNGISTVFYLWTLEKRKISCHLPRIEPRFLWRAGRSPVTRVTHAVPTLHFMWHRSITSNPNVGNGGRDFTYTIWDINHSVFQVFPFRTIHNDNITLTLAPIKRSIPKLFWPITNIQHN